ncbi:MAG: hypothetical protein R2764_11950 [Bacteroidales bacterium]
MKQIETIADFNAELFIKKHFSNLNKRDRMVRAMRDSVRNTIKESLIRYELERIKS